MTNLEIIVAAVAERKRRDFCLNCHAFAEWQAVRAGREFSNWQPPLVMK